MPHPPTGGVDETTASGYSLEVESVDFLNATIANKDWVALRSEPKPADRRVAGGLRETLEAHNFLHSAVRNMDPDNSRIADVVPHIDILAVRRPQVKAKQFTLRQGGPLLDFRVK